MNVLNLLRFESTFFLLGHLSLRENGHCLAAWLG